MSLVLAGVSHNASPLALLVRRLLEVIAGSSVGCIAWNWVFKQIRKKAFSRLADRDTGAQRRSSCPIALEMSKKFMKGSFDLEMAGKRALKNNRAFLTLRNGQNIFYQTWAPESGEVSGIVIIIHGFGDHCDFTMALKAKTICSMGNFAAAAFDLPGHGRSDGALADVPDWFEFVDAAREIVAEHLKPQLLQQFPGRKIFAIGESMGGGVLFTMLVKEKTLFDGAILVCPMLYVSREIFPPWIVVQLLKYVLKPALPEWPVAPAKDLLEHCNSDPAMRQFVREGAGEHSQIVFGMAKPRIRTAFELGIRSGEWMRSKILEYDTPSLIVHGGADIVTDPRVSQELFQNMKAKDKEFLYPDGIWHGDLFHGGPMHYEGTKERYGSLLRWLSDRC